MKLIAVRTAKCKEQIPSWKFKTKALACESNGRLVNIQVCRGWFQPSEQHTVDLTPGRCFTVSRGKFKYHNNRCKHSNRIWATNQQKQMVLFSLPTNAPGSALYGLPSLYENRSGLHRCPEQIAWLGSNKGRWWHLSRQQNFLLWQWSEGIFWEQL